MALTRVVPIPLERRLEVLWGLTVEDLPWLAGAVIADVAAWHGIPTGLSTRLLVMAMVSLPAGLMAWFRLEERTIPQWIWLWISFQVHPKQYLRGPRGEDSDH